MHETNHQKREMITKLCRFPFFLIRNDYKTLQVPGLLNSVVFTSKGNLITIYDS